MSAGLSGRADYMLDTRQYRRSLPIFLRKGFRVTPSVEILGVVKRVAVEVSYAAACPDQATGVNRQIASVRLSLSRSLSFVFAGGISVLV